MPKPPCVVPNSPLRSLPHDATLPIPGTEAADAKDAPSPRIRRRGVRDFTGRGGTRVLRRERRAGRLARLGDSQHSVAAMLQAKALPAQQARARAVGSGGLCSLAGECPVGAKSRERKAQRDGDQREHQGRPAERSGLRERRVHRLSCERHRYFPSTGAGTAATLVAPAALVHQPYVRRGLPTNGYRTSAIQVIRGERGSNTAEHLSATASSQLGLFTGSSQALVRLLTNPKRPRGGVPREP